jgi:hypothetical protein
MAKRPVARPRELIRFLEQNGFVFMNEPGKDVMASRYVIQMDMGGGVWALDETYERLTMRDWRGNLERL